MIDDNKESPNSSNDSKPPGSLNCSLILRTSDLLPGDVLLYARVVKALYRKKYHRQRIAHTRMPRFTSAET
jgi:hypothetical protein